MLKDKHSPAFPTSFNKNYPTEIVGGMTLCQYAAIKLRVPDSGTGWLDEMITKSLQDEFALTALQCICASGPSASFSNLQIAAEAYALADAMLEARK